MKKITLTEFRMTCSACPSQWEGKTDKGKRVYVRYRFGYLSFSVNNGDESQRVLDYEEIFGKNLGNEFDGLLSTQDLMFLTKHFVTYPKGDK